MKFGVIRDSQRVWHVLGDGFIIGYIGPNFLTQGRMEFIRNVTWPELTLDETAEVEKLIADKLTILNIAQRLKS